MIMFWSYDCLACDAANQHLFKLSDAYGSKVDFLKIDSQENLDIVKSYGIITIPTFIFYRNNKNLARIEGFKKKFEIERKIREFL